MRQRGTTLVEIMIAMLLASIVSAFILMITRSQLVAYEQNDQVARMQQNERAGLGYVEQILRRACGGLGHGRVQATSTLLMDCVRVTSPANGTDTIDVIYGTTPWSATDTLASPVYDVGSATPYINVADGSSFSVGDKVLLTDFYEGVILTISAKSVTTSPRAKLSLGNATPVTSGLTTSPAWAPTYVMKVVSYTIYVDSPTDATTPEFRNMLMLDPDGVLGGTDHSDAQPIVENVVDFQASIGFDDDGDGKIKTENKSSANADEWYGNYSGELPAAVGLWNNGAGTKLPHWLRLGLIFQTSNKYPGTAPALPQFEDRTTAPATPAGGTPRYRPVQIVIAPRVWNLLN